MPTCVFKTDEVRRCVEHALNSPAWSMGWMEELQPVPGLFFVHDQGVYLMSNGEPRDLIDDGRKTYTAYAEGCNPETNEDWWDAGRELVGGDDFAEVLPVNQDWLAKLGRYEELEITVTGSEISWKFVKPKRIVRVV